MSWRPDTCTVQWSVSSAAQGTATSIEPTKPSTSSKGDSMDSSTSFTDWEQGRDRSGLGKLQMWLSPWRPHFLVCSDLGELPGSPCPSPCYLSATIALIDSYSWGLPKCVPSLMPEKGGAEG